jgi:hypothetical protein
MLIIFKSKASGDVIMRGENGKEMLRLMGKDADESKGIFTAEQLPAAIVALKQAIAADRPVPDPHRTEKPTGTASDADDGVLLYHRALPVLDLMERSLRDDAYVTWGV